MKILILGGTGFIGSKIVARRPTWQWTIHGREAGDLLNQNSLSNINDYYDVVINAAGFYGGIVFNQIYQQKILQTNLEMTANIWQLLNRLQPKKFINIGSACIYPKTVTDQIFETQIGDRNYHPSIKFSAVAKHIQLDLLQHSNLNWEYLILSNVYGPGEHLNFEKSHFVGSIIKKLKDNENYVKMLGTGVAVRDFIYIDDVTEAVCRYAELPQATCAPTNIGTGVGTSIASITQQLTQIVNSKIEIDWGSAHDDGVRYKVLNNAKMVRDINYQPMVQLKEGLKQTWEYFKNV
jgi:GDP-L-fucose synthase